MPLHACHVANAFLLAVVFIQILKPLAGRFGLVDAPRGRKRHEGVVPVVGGIALFAAVAVAGLIAAPDLRTPWSLPAGLAILVLVGVLDDRHDIAAPAKLVGQILAAIVLVAPDPVVLGGVVKLLGLDPQGKVAIAISVVFVVALINAYNMLDGVDGLAGGVVAATLFWLIGASIFANRPETLVLMLLLGGTLGFLVFNQRHRWRPTAEVFMGDAGSMALGAAVAWSLMRFDDGKTVVVSMAAMSLVLALPLIDMASVSLRRLKAGRSPFSADRRHLHHLLLDAGVGPGRTAVILVAITFVSGGIGILGHHAGVPEGVLFALIPALAALHSAFVSGLLPIGPGKARRPDALEAAAPSRSGRPPGRE